MVCTQPLDTIRVQMQASRAQAGPSVLRLVSQQGFTLFRGIYSPIMFIGAWKALIFSSYEVSLRGIAAARARYGLGEATAHFDAQPASTADVCTAAAMSGLIGNVLAGPIDMVKCNAQALPRRAGTSMFMHEVHTARHIISRGKHGTRLPRPNFLALYNGVGIHIAFSSFSMAVWFGLNKVMKEQHQRYRDTPISFLERVVIGGVAGSISWLVAYPLDGTESSAWLGIIVYIVHGTHKALTMSHFTVMRTLRQTSLLKDGAWHTYRECYQLALAATGSHSFLFRGMGVTVSRGVVQCGVTMAVFDSVMEAIENVCDTDRDLSNRRC